MGGRVDWDWRGVGRGTIDCREGSVIMGLLLLMMLLTMTEVFPIYMKVESDPGLGFAMGG